MAIMPGPDFPTGGVLVEDAATLAEAYKIAQMRGQRMHPLAAFHWATRGNAVALGIEDRVGSVQPGRFADLVVLDPRATQAMTVWLSVWTVSASPAGAARTASRTARSSAALLSGASSCP